MYIAFIYFAIDFAASSFKKGIFISSASYSDLQTLSDM